jgi:hypothetical protein
MSVAEEFRPGRKLLRAVAELHTRGFQRLRVVCHLYEIGTWRCLIAPASWISAEHGAKLASTINYHDVPGYSSAAGRSYWGWEDKHHASPSRLAEVFLERHPDTARLGYGEDWSYVGWFQHMLHVTYPDALPIAYSDQHVVGSGMESVGRSVHFDRPPAGWAVPRR